MAKLRNRRSLVDHENLAHLLPSIKLTSIARKNSHIQHNHAHKTGKLEPTHIHHIVNYIIIISYPCNSQACYDSSFNTLRLDLTHPDIYIYNLVGFSGCLHLWQIPLLDPELLDPELCNTSFTMNQISLTTRLALTGFQASCYSHHKIQSALGETNWLLRVSGCNLTLNPYLVIQMGHHHGHPLTGAMGLRPDH